MKKRVYRYFIDFMDGQTEWLNQMAAQGWRLVKCGQISYEFENCTPGEYEYAVEFVADKSFSDSKAYREFLESAGYNTFYKNINVGKAIGKVSWRPWATGAGQIVTAPGGYFKELLIVEKKNDGKPIELHTELTDKLSVYNKIRSMLLWAAGGAVLMFALFLVSAAIYIYNGFTAGAAGFFIGAILFLIFGCFWLKPLRKINKKIRVWEEEAKTYEYEPPKKSKKIAGIAAAVIITSLFGVFIFKIASGDMGYSSSSSLMLSETNGKNYWNTSYSKLNGFRQRSLNLGEGTYTFTVEIVTNSGELDFSVKDKDGTVYFSDISISTSTFSFVVDSREKIIIRLDARNHSGGFKIRW